MQQKPGSLIPLVSFPVSRRLPPGAPHGEVDAFPRIVLRQTAAVDAGHIAALTRTGQGATLSRADGAQRALLCSDRMWQRLDSPPLPVCLFCLILFSTIESPRAVHPCHAACMWADDSTNKSRGARAPMRLAHPPGSLARSDCRGPTIAPDQTQTCARNASASGHVFDLVDAVSSVRFEPGPNTGGEHHS